MKLNRVLATGVITGLLAAPLAAFASDDPHGLIDYKMGIATHDAVAAPVTDADLTPDGDVHGNTGYSVADLKSGMAEPIVTSRGAAAQPADAQIHKNAGIAGNKSEAGARGAVVSADNAAVGRIERVVHGAKADTVYVRVSDTLRTDVSQFRIDVPKGAMHHGQVRLSMTLSDLMAHLDRQG